MMRTHCKLLCIPIPSTRIGSKDTYVYVHVAGKVGDNFARAELIDLYDLIRKRQDAPVGKRWGRRNKVR